MSLRKILPLTVFLLLLPWAVLAARTAPGAVPSIPPLQPLPQGAKPQLKSNITSGPEGRSAVEPAEEPQETPAGTLGEPGEAAEGPEVTASPPRRASGWPWLVLAGILASLSGYVLLRRRP